MFPSPFVRLTAIDMNSLNFCLKYWNPYLNFSNSSLNFAGLVMHP